MLDTSQSNINIGGATSTITYDNAGFMTITNNNSSASYINIPIATDNVEVGQPYTLKVDWGTSELTYIYLQNSNDDYSKYVYTTTTTTTTNTPVSNFLKVLILVNANKTIKVRVQVQKGTTIGEYEPYGSGKWYKKGNIYKIANKTNWSVDNIASNNRAVISLGGNGFPYSSDIGYASANAISNNFIGIAQVNQASTTEINNVAINNANMYIKFEDSINTKALAKAQLDSMTNLEIYYVVATPNDIQITNTNLISQLDNLEKLKSYNGVTNINCSGNLSAILGVSAIKGE